ncbi:MAG: replication-associated recombination protein A [Sarcina ventriculi]|uniref:replication-associated recombination protein A n=1 Tax=Sarcina ventriculi TaxID=1267 RepID=UPI001C0F6C74|nr:replication-associated recombination protein A [Sarcina ventriculi]MDO4402609.1 replication-associated recombination protein A [Clostridiaceae bacterium]MBU5322185.1 replication-associated recombination protein A [Sarcina ventriculi]MCI5636186.1 replication-associated recombination protein A [Sarcina ventriculi]MDD7373911.1 replication-associated recombination protein A [Sarcina ventriculi]MDY7061699.1 replication-associated recombination protein A [Sarcina ventriculi]
MRPLADKIRPKTLDNVVGQKHLIGNNKILRRIIEKKEIPNMIFFGPSGVGKTTISNIIVNQTDKKLFKLNATTASLKDIEDITKNLDNLYGYNGVVLYLDEIQNFNKRQQQSLLSYIENGQITLIASTTENPYFSVYSALISRCLIFEFKPLNSDDIFLGLKNTINSLNEQESLNISYDIDALKKISILSKGDLRKAINILDVLIKSNLKHNIHIDLTSVLELNTESFFMDESKYYDYISMLQKSIRGSDTDASILALSVLLKTGHFDDIIRRLLVIASEDCGLAMGNMYSSFFSLINAAKMVGMPEAKIILAHAVILLSTSPKSNSAYVAISKAFNDIEKKDIGPVLNHLRDCHYEGSKKLGITGYKYPHDYPNHYVKQDYMPDNLKGTTYYTPCDNKYENSLKEYWSKIK